MIESQSPDRSARRGVIFDLDGTLADTLADIAAALNAALRAIDRPDASLERVRAWVGEGLPTLCRRAIPDADDTTLHRFIDAARNAYRRHPLDHTVLYPGIRELLDRLAGLAIPAAVLSNKPHDLTVRTVEGLKIADRFTDVRGYVTEEDRKPSPTAALEIARRWKAEPADVLFVGDGQADIDAARAAGMVPVAVTWGFRSRNELAAAGATVFVDRPLEILELLQSR
jgi:phosphoglycolate phosphatase